jgi:hypothetical protein
MVPSGLCAQTSLEIPLQFDFVNPGAKSLALGGAFAGVADDATASFANPAGLTVLVSPEMSAEFRRSRVTTTSLEGGRLSGTATRIGADQHDGAIFGDNIRSRSGPRYLSAVFPLPSHRWVFAGYRHELARLRQRQDSYGVFQQDPTESLPRRELPYEVERDISIDGYGFSGAYKLSRHIAVGAGLSLYTFSIDNLFREFGVRDLYDLADYSVATDALRLQGDAIGIAPTFGVTVDRGRARLGVVYRHGPSFDFSAQDAGGPPRSATFRVPHTLGIGLSVRASRLLVSGEVTRITYSRLVEDFVNEQTYTSGQQASFRIHDGTEYHVGGQYALPQIRMRLRAGAWYDPDHAVHFHAARTPATAAERLFDERFQTALSRGRTQAHVTGGVGLTVTPRLEVNMGLDAARLTRQLSVSAIVHMGAVVQ